MKGYTFNRQRPVLNYIADFMCKELLLIIEVDGFSHYNEEAYLKDVKRQQTLENNDFKVIRFLDHEVLTDIQNVIRCLEITIEEREIELNRPSSPIPSKRKSLTTGSALETITILNN